ncbi:MAG: PDZ domain-containing protein [Verrucomicrobia bacterium]|nr:PDZ domain-containing protein [Verrucomicrobiota bacterium]
MCFSSVILAGAWRAGTGFSGLIVSPDGYIVTNQHVANREANPKIRVTLVNGKDYEAVLLRDDDLQDLALIKVEAKEPLPFLSLDKLSPNMLGQTVLVLGNPVGYENSVSAGSSAKMSMAQNLPVESIGFAIPAERVKRWVEEAIAIVEGKIKAPPERSAAVALKEKFGLELKDCNPNESLQLGYQGRNGLLVTAVEKGSPAAEAGIQKGMLVVGLGQVPARTLEELPRKVRQLKGGEQVMVTVLGAMRQGNFISLRSGTVTLKAR